MDGEGGTARFFWWGSRPLRAVPSSTDHPSRPAYAARTHVRPRTRTRTYTTVACTRSGILPPTHLPRSATVGCECTHAHTQHVSLFLSLSLSPLDSIERGVARKRTAARLMNEPNDPNDRPSARFRAGGPLDYAPPPPPGTIRTTTMTFSFALGLCCALERRVLRGPDVTRRSRRPGPFNPRRARRRVSYGLLRTVAKIHRYASLDSHNTVSILLIRSQCRWNEKVVLLRFLETCSYVEQFNLSCENNINVI